MKKNPFVFLSLAALLLVAGCAKGAASDAASASIVESAAGSAAGTTSGSVPLNEIPMFGNQPLTEKQKKSNADFVKKADGFKGGRPAAFETTLKLGWAYLYEKRDPVTAMKRFNQAWLLDPDNDEVFFAFGFLTSMQGKTDEAVLYYKQCLAINPNHPIALANLARSYKDQAYQIYLKKKSNVPDQDVKDRLTGALALYEKASRSATETGTLRLTTLEEDLSYIYYQWAVALEFNGEYAKAWEKIKLARQHGGERLIEPNFIKELSGLMPEPPDA